MSLITVEDKVSLERDSRSQAILNTDKSAYQAFMARKQKQKKEEREKQDLQDRVSFLEKHIEELECRFQRLEKSLETTA